LYGYLLEVHQDEQEYVIRYGIMLRGYLFYQNRISDGSDGNIDHCSSSDDDGAEDESSQLVCSSNLAGCNSIASVHEVELIGLVDGAKF